ncbi:MAG: sulfatase [Bacteroidales bacterium]|nr:sulfatase [Bacteroidales bacterium]
MKKIPKINSWEQLIDCCLHKQNPFFKHFHELILVFLIALGISSCKQEKQKKKKTSEKRPNIVILFADDMGYGDPSCYGNATIRTPNIDSLASDGIRFTSFVTGVVSVPSRCQLMTGRYRQRVNFGGGTGSGGQGGLPESELTLAEGLKEAGYATGMLGKWHLGYAQKKYLPVNQGFDSWFGLPYSNDMRKPWVQTDVPLGIYEDTTMVEHPVNQNTLTTRYTKRARQFISSHAGKKKPFFLYLAYNMPHLPIHTTEKFRGKSNAGLYGDVIQTIDWSVGQVIQSLEEEGITGNTVVFFASDNGPWLDLPDRMLQEGNKPWHAGSPGPLRGHKATTYEGGARVPAMMKWPGMIREGRVTDELAATQDIYQTMLKIGGAELPDHPLDGYNLLPFLKGETDESPRNEYYYFRGNELQAMRKGEWKLREVNGKTQLFNLQEDPGERFNRAPEKPEIVEEIRKEMKEFAEEVNAEVAENK